MQRIPCLMAKPLLELLAHHQLGDSYGEKEKAKVVEYVTENASFLLGMRPIVFPISSRNALESKTSFMPKFDVPAYIESRIWKRSGFQSLQEFLIHELTNEAKVMTKLCNPIRVAESIARDALEALDSRDASIESDKATLSLLNKQMKAWKAEIENDMANDCSLIKGLFEKKGDRVRDSILHEGLINQLSLYLSYDKFEKHCARHMLDKGALDSNIDSIIRESS